MELTLKFQGTNMLLIFPYGPMIKNKPVVMANVYLGYKFYSVCKYFNNKKKNKKKQKNRISKPCLLQLVVLTIGGKHHFQPCFSY